MKIVILAGGGGTRLFPLSRASFPKQFLKIDGHESLLSQTVRRFLPLVAPSDILVVTNKDYRHHVQVELASIGASGAHILLEPVAKNTAPAIALAARYCLDKMGAQKDDVLFVSPADHVIKPVDAFVKGVRQAIKMAQTGKIVTFGVKPTEPETGYGYIQASQPIDDGGFVVESFREKPDRATAEKYVALGNYYWNSGMFAFTVNQLFKELAAFQPDIHAIASLPYDAALEQFDAMPNISIDYAVAEKSKLVATIPLPANWNDIGSWDAIYDVLPKDESGNAIQGDCLPLDCQNTLMLGRSRLLAGIGLENLLVVETDDVIVVAQKGESQKVKDLVTTLKAKGRREADEHTTIYRPWGSYTVLNEGPGYKIKKIVVNPGAQLSLQLHYHRSEHWIITSGTAKVTIGDTNHMVHENEGIFVPQSTKHRVENPGKLPLEIIEVQNGKYLGEDDIVRFEDIYGRV